jgi:hypothetical protein
MTTMRIGFGTYMLDPVEIATALASDADMMELLIPKGRLESAIHLRRDVLAPRGIEAILTILCLPDQIYFDSEGALLPWADGQDYLNIFTPRFLRVVGVQKTDGDAAFVKRMVKQIKGIMPEVERRDIVLAYENHGEKLTIVQGMLAGIRHPRFKILLDCGNGYMSGETPDIVTDALLSSAAYFHIKDVKLGPNGETLPQVCCPVGDGDLDWPKLFRKIKKVVPDPICVFELPGWAGHAAKGYRKSLAAFRKAVKA